MRFEVRRNFRWRSDEVFLELLGELAHECNLDIAKDKLDFFDELVDVVRAGVENLSSFFVFQLLEQVDALGALLGREILERKVVGRHAARDECGNHRAWSWDGANVNAFADAFAYEIECRVCNAGRSCIAYEGDVAGVLQKVDVLGRDLFFVEVMVGFHGRRDAVIVKENSRMAGVFGKDEGNFFKDAHSAVGDIFHVPDGSCYDV